MADELKMLLYKYRSPIVDFEKSECFTSRIFANAELYYAKPSSFNDPYEAHIELDTSASREQAINSHLRVLSQRRLSKGQTPLPIQQMHAEARQNVDALLKGIEHGTLDLEGYYRDSMDQHGLLSLSAERSNILMWSHYGSEHKGLCLGFDWEKSGLPAAVEVAYHSMYRKIDIWSHTEDELAKIACFQKSNEWAYEKEWRSISSAQFENYDDLYISEDVFPEWKEANESQDRLRIERMKEKHTYEFRRPTLLGPRTRRFEKEALVEVVFGARMSDESIVQHVEMIDANGFSPEYFRIARNRIRYSLDVVPLLL